MRLIAALLRLVMGEMRMTIRTTMISLAALGLAAGPASAAVLYESTAFTSDGIGLFASNVLVGETNPGGVSVPRELYNAFTIAADSTIESITLGFQSGKPTEVQFFAADNTGKPVGALIASYGLSGIEGPVSSFALATGQFNYQTFDFADFGLVAGDYVVGFVSADRNGLSTVGQWTGAAGQVGFYADGHDGAVGPNSSYITGRGTAFQINGTIDNVSVIPEPASWAMMIGGFGLVGGTLRSRRAVRPHLA